MSTIYKVATSTEQSNSTPKSSKISPHANIPLPTTSSAPDWYTDSKPRGVWWLLWRLYGALRLYYIEWLPTPHHWGRLSARIRSNHQRMWSLSRWALGVFMTIALNGGVGKTTTITWAATDYAEHTDLSVLIVDADSGARGKTAIRLLVDMSDESYNFNTVKDLILKEGWSPSSEELSTFLPRHEASGARLLASSEEIFLTSHQTRKMIRKLRPASGAVFIDTTPGTKEDNTRGAQQEATIVSTVCLYDSDDLLHNINTMRDSENEQGGRFDRRLENGTLFIVVGDVPWRDFNRRTQYRLAAELNVPAKQVVLLPRDKHVKRSGPVIQSAVSRRFRYAISEYNRLLAEAAARYNKESPLENPRGLKKPSNDQRSIKRAVSQLVGLTGSPEAAAEHVWLEELDVADRS